MQTCWCDVLLCTLCSIICEFHRDILHFFSWNIHRYHLNLLYCSTVILSSVPNLTPCYMEHVVFDTTPHLPNHIYLSPLKCCLVLFLHWSYYVSVPCDVQLSKIVHSHLKSVWTCLNAVCLYWLQLTGNEVLTAQETPRYTTCTTRAGYWQDQHHASHAERNWVTETGTGTASYRTQNIWSCQWLHALSMP